jgi:hypothetical protein
VEYESGKQFVEKSFPHFQFPGVSESMGARATKIPPLLAASTFEVPSCAF